jgi:WD40-like Beta Propeller Repeat
VRSLALAAALFLCAARAADGQLPPNEDWRTLRTRHFRVHFTPAVEEEARRAAVNAERAYAELSTELVPPRGTIDLVVSDNVDFVNGYATPFPSNRIVVYAHPPTDASGLRNYDDWNALVVTHELTHIFHLDRSRGIWRFGQAIFGRNPLLFPNLYEPTWVLEGLAVYFESRMTGVGRLESSEHSMTARAAALANRLPTLQELSPGTTRFPGANVVYIYGSLLFDYLSRTRGPGSIRQFVETGSKTPFPFILTLTSRNAFGMSFQTAWEHWRDSLTREMRSPHDVMPGWRQLTNGGRVALFPRWFGDTTLIYAGDNAREMPSAYEVTLSGRETRLGRRNGTSPNVRMPDGGILFSQPDFLDPYHIRNDLYVERKGSQTRLTTGARLTSPDVRVDGEIVAVQDEPATTRLVRLSSDARTLVPLTPTSIDVQWADPRWSPDGSRIAAVKQSRGRSEIAIIGSDGKMIDSFGATHAINSSPSWSPDGTHIYFSSERGGSPQIYVADVTTFAPTVARISDASTGLFAPEASPDQSQLATLLFKADGYHLGVAPFVSLTPVATDSTRTSPRSGCANCLADVPGLAPLGASDSSRATKYSPWVSLLPRYWSPVVESTTGDGTSWGASTSGSDIVDRHDYVVEVLHNSRWAENSAWLWYRYAGLGLPLIDLYASQNYSNANFDASGAFNAPFGFTERARIVSLQATFIRPRFRTYTLASIGGELEGDAFSTLPDTVLRHLLSFFSQTHNYPALVASAGWSNAQRPGMSISPEDGISISASGRQRWRAGTTGGATRSVVGTTLAYKSLDLPGFAHHVLALRAAGGITDEESPDLFSAGGISGTALELFPGITAGQQRRTFGVRGYPAGAEGGIRAYSAAVEYRAPLAAPSRGFRYFPVFVDRMSLTLFGETGRAFCPASADTTNGFCTSANIRNPAMTSAGAELNIDTGLQLDVQARLRLGLAFPLVNRAQLGASVAQAYATFGASF